MSNPSNVITGCDSEFSSTIDAALLTLGKHGYEVRVHDLEMVRFITFTLGESEQTLAFKNDEWRKEGVVSKAIVDHLNI